MALPECTDDAANLYEAVWAVVEAHPDAFLIDRADWGDNAPAPCSIVAAGRVRTLQFYRERVGSVPVARDIFSAVLRRTDDGVRLQGVTGTWLPPATEALDTELSACPDLEAEDVESVVLSTQHHPDISQEDLRAQIQEVVIDPVLESTGLDLSGVTYYINPAGPFVIGGPKGDAGLTGRKIIIDTYGGASRHGGGAFSGKDPSKVDRSAAYAMRWVAKNAVAAGLADRLEVQVAYAIGKAAPVGLYVETFGTAHVADEIITTAILDVFDLRPKAIIDQLDLLRPIYAQTAAYGHFGRELADFTWERTDRVDDLRSAAGL